MHPQPSHGITRPAPRGFTLTELLVVIAIIGVLVAITSVAVVRALGTAKQTRMKTEVDQLDAAFKAYKEKYGSYPPHNLRFAGGVNGTAPAQVRQHVAQAFPRYNLAHLEDDLKATGIEIDRRRPDQAIVFWLSGFSSDPLHPFVTVNGNIIDQGVATNRKSNATPFFEFDESRLSGVAWPTQPQAGDQWKTFNNQYGMNSTGWIPSYFPQGVNPSQQGAPYVYFDAADYERTAAAANTPPQPNRFNNPPNVNSNERLFADAGVAVPYFFDSNSNGQFDYDSNGDIIEDWVNPDSFQIIASGGDGVYGSAANVSPQPCRLFPTGLNYDTSQNLYEDDNVTNFCNQARLGSAKP